MKSNELKVGMELWKDRQNDVYSGDDYFAYFERIEITGIEDGIIWLTRQHLYFEGEIPTTDDDGWTRGTGNNIEKEMLATGSSNDELEMRKDYWDESWANNIFYTKQEVKQRVINYLFEERG